MKHVLGDWEIATIAASTSGQAITVFTTDVPGLRWRSFAEPATPTTSGRTGHGRVVQGLRRRAKEQILNPAAFTLTGFQLGTIGNEGRGFCDGPDYFAGGPVALQEHQVSGRVKAQLRFEVFNVFNRTNFLSNQINILFQPSAVTFDTGNAATATQITGFSGVPNNFGQSTATRDARQAQFGIKLIF